MEEGLDENATSRFDELLYLYKIPILLITTGLLIIGVGIFFAKDYLPNRSNKIQVLSTSSEVSDAPRIIFVEVVGAVKNPSVFEMDYNSRINDALTKAGGLSDDADHIWIDKNINRAALLKDGQKLYIKSVDEQLDISSASSNEGYQSGSTGNLQENSTIVNINTASAAELEGLWGIGRVIAQNIIDQRPYSSVEELVSKKILKQNVYDRNKKLMVAY